MKVLRTPGSETCKEERIEWRGYDILWFALTLKELRTVQVGEGGIPDLRPTGEQAVGI